jgi:hypothetical protein
MLQTRNSQRFDGQWGQIFYAKGGSKSNFEFNLGKINGQFDVWGDIKHK